jgi:hypothetical protein
MERNYGWRDEIDMDEYWKYALRRWVTLVEFGRPQRPDVQEILLERPRAA